MIKESADIVRESHMPPTTFWGRLKALGPGIVLALASVGASDMVTTLNTGAKYGMALAWVFIVGLILKYAISDGVSRLQLSDNRSLFSHFTEAGGRIFPSLILIAELLIGVFFGSGVTAISSLILVELFEGLPYWPTFAVVLASAVIMLWIGKYSIVEKTMMGLAILMFLGIVYLAITSVLGGAAVKEASQTFIPVFPADSLISVLSLIGGVGGATGIMAYTYFVREKKWDGAQWKATMRTDLGFSYILVAIFAVAMTLVGAYWLFDKGYEVDSNDAVFQVGNIISNQFGSFAHVLFLLCFFAVTYSSVIGGFQGISYVTGDCIRVIRRYPHQDEPRYEMSAKSSEFRFALIWLTVFTIIISQFGRPVTLVLIYASISAFVLPLLSVALIILLNRKTTEKALKNGWLSNTLLAICLAFFTYLAAMQVVETVQGLIS